MTVTPSIFIPTLWIVMAQAKVCGHTLGVSGPHLSDWNHKGLSDDEFATSKRCWQGRYSRMRAWSETQSQSSSIPS